MPDTSRQSTYKKNRNNLSYNPLYATSALIKSVGDAYKKATSPQPKKKAKK